MDGVRHPVRRGLLTGVLAVWIAASLTCSLSAEPRYTADPALEGPGTLYRLLIYTVRSFFTGDPEAGACLALCAGLLLWGLPSLRSTGLERGLAGCFGLLFASFQLLGLSYSQEQSWRALFGSRFVCFRGAVCLGGRALLAACLALYAFRLLDRLSGRPVPAQRPFPRKRFLLAAGLVALCWLPYFWAFYPGLSSPDTGMQIAWALHKPTPWLQYSPLRGPDIYATNHHPYLVTLLFGLFAKLGLALGDLSRGVALYCALQLLLTALVMTAAWYYLRRLGLSERAFRGGLAFTALFPLFPLYAITMLKDSLFSLACLGFSLLLFETARTKGEALRRRSFLLLLSAAALLVALTKNQGVYFVAAAGICALACCRPRLRAAAALLIPVLLFQVVWIQILLPAWNVAPGGKQEVLGLLFQQTARYVSTYPEEVTEEEAEAIRAVLDYDRLPELYEPRLADPVKFTFRQDASPDQLSAYYHAWSQMLRKHPAVYAEALLNNIYGGFFVRHETALSYTDFDNRETAPYPELCVTPPPRQRAAGAPAGLPLAPPAGPPGPLPLGGPLRLPGRAAAAAVSPAPGPAAGDPLRGGAGGRPGERELPLRHAHDLYAPLPAGLPDAPGGARRGLGGGAAAPAADPPLHPGGRPVLPHRLRPAGPAGGGGGMARPGRQRRVLHRLRGGELPVQRPLRLPPAGGRRPGARDDGVPPHERHRPGAEPGADAGGHPGPGAPLPGREAGRHHPCHGL